MVIPCSFQGEPVTQELLAVSRGPACALGDTCRPVRYVRCQCPIEGDMVPFPGCSVGPCQNIYAVAGSSVFWLKAG